LFFPDIKQFLIKRDRFQEKSLTKRIEIQQLSVEDEVLSIYPVNLTADNQILKKSKKS